MRGANIARRFGLLLVAGVLALVASAANRPSSLATTTGDTSTSTTLVPLPLGSQVAGAAVGASGVWVANGRTGTVSRLDPLTAQIVSTIPVADPSPTCERCWGAVAAHGKAVWVAMDSAGRVIARIDPAVERVTTTIAVEVQPYGLLVDEDGAVWLTASLENAVVKVDPLASRVTARLAAHLPSGIAVDKQSVWVTSPMPGTNGQVVRFDRRTEEVVATVPVGRQPGALAVGHGSVWVANEADHTISRIDPHTNAVAATIPVVHLPVGIAIGEGAVWVTSRGFSVLSTPAVSRIDPSTNTVVETTLIDGTGPVAMVAGEGSLWVASRNPDAMIRIGPVPLPVSADATDGSWLAPVALTAATGLLLLLGAALQRGARNRCGRPAPDGHLLAGLLQMTAYARQQAGERAVRPGGKDRFDTNHR